MLPFFIAFSVDASPLNQPTPAIVAQSAVRRLPRLALLLLCAAYLLPGLVGRGPWKTADVVAFGYMAELARSGHSLAQWFDPRLLYLPPETPALLPYWIGAWAIKISPAWISPDLAVRFVFALLLWGTFTTTWSAVYFLARTSAAQPVAFAFGGEAQPKDYARAVADGGLLALIGCFGLAQLGHETTPALAQLFFASSLFYGVCALPYRRVGPTIAVFLGSTGLALSGAPALALLLGFGSLAIAWRQRRRAVGRSPAMASVDFDGAPAPGASYPAGAILTLVTGFVLALALSLALHLLQWRFNLPGSRNGVSAPSELRSLLNLLLWFTWPTWPLAIWTLWRWRRQLRARHVALPVLFLAIPLLATFTTSFGERSLLLGLPALATLAAFALPTFRRSAAALIDWFTLLFFSGSAIVIWVIWISVQTGIPPKPAANVARLAPGFVPEFSAPAFAFALIATVAWCWLVKWRTGRHRSALWKTLVLPAGGAALCWLLVNTLWLPALDYARSYAPQVSAIEAKVGNPECISELGLARAHIAAIRHAGGFLLRPLTSASTCDWLLVNPEALERLRFLVTLSEWRLIGTLRRPTSANDDLLLYQRIGVGGGPSPTARKPATPAPEPEPTQATLVPDPASIGR